MAERLIGERALHARMRALEKKSPRAVLGRLALAAVREQKLLVARQTGTTGRSIRVGRVTDSYAETVAGGAAAYLEFGTRPHLIVPRRARALRWAASPQGRRLSGRPRSAAQRGGLGGVRFARRVRHPGTRPQPFMRPGAIRAAAGREGPQAIVEVWNGAA